MARRTRTDGNRMDRLFLHSGTPGMKPRRHRVMCPCAIQIYAAQLHIKGCAKGGQEHQQQWVWRQYSMTFMHSVQL